MSRLDSARRLLRRWFTSIPFFIVLGLLLGVAIALPLVPRPGVATIPISGIIMGQDYADDALNMLRKARDDRSIRAVVLQIDSPGGEVSAIEQVYLDVLRLRSRKPVVASIGSMAASGGYYVALGANFIYAQPTSQIGSIGATVGLPQPEELDERILTTGLFKATGSSKRKITAKLEMVRQEFVGAVKSQRGERLKLSDEEVSRAEVYSGIDGLRYGLIDEIGTSTDAIKKAASLAGIRNYAVEEFYIPPPIMLFFFGAKELKSQTGLMPTYYYLAFESE